MSERDFATVWHGGMKTALPGVDQYPEYRRQKYGSILQQHAPNSGDFLTTKEAAAMVAPRADLGIGAKEPKRRVGRPVGSTMRVSLHRRPKTITNVCIACQTALTANQIRKGLIRCRRCRQTRSGSQKGQTR